MGLVLHGCASTYRVVEFEVLEPATVNLPEYVHQLIVMNRAPFTFDAFSEEDRQGLDVQQLKIIDTLIVNSLCRGLLNNLRQSPIERFHQPLWKSERRMDTTLLDDLILTRKEVDEICETTGVDAILSLESYSMDLDKKIDYYVDGAELTKYYEVSSKIRWIIYLKGSPRPFDDYTMIDTLFFPEMIDGEFLEFYSTARMIREAFYNKGLNYGRYLVPVWIPTARSIFKGREDSLKIASKQTDLGDWDSAYSIWKDLTVSGDSTTVAKAFHNMAVYYELEDHLDSSNILINRALEYDTLEAVKAYREELEIRNLNRKELLNQVK